MRVRLAVVCLAVAMAWPGRSHALDLVQAWELAQQHAPAAARARAAREADAAQADEAHALWRPTLAAEGGAGYGGSDSATRGARFGAPGLGSSAGVSFDTEVDGGRSTHASLVLRQPLYDPERTARAESLEIAARSADPRWTQARQALMLRTAGSYLDVGLAAERVRVLRRQQAAVDSAATEARDRFAIGDRPIKDVHESEARAAALRAELLAAQARLSQVTDVLADLVGSAVDPETMQLPTDANLVDAGPEQSWIDRAASGNPALRLAQARLQAAQATDRAAAAAFSPTVDLVAQVGRERLVGDGIAGTSSYSARNRAVGVQVNVPLYTGGLRTARHAQSRALVEQARADVDEAREQAVREARAAWTDLAAGRARTSALESALRASRARLDATGVGVGAGDRTTLDLLNAQNDASQAELALAQARASLLVRRLELSATAGELDDEQLRRVDALLQPTPH